MKNTLIRLILSKCKPFQANLLTKQQAFLMAVDAIDFSELVSI